VREDYEVKKRIPGKSPVFNLLEQREGLLHTDRTGTFNNEVVIGLPASLHLFEELSFGKGFFPIYRSVPYQRKFS